MLQARVFNISPPYLHHVLFLLYCSTPRYFLHDIINVSDPQDAVAFLSAVGFASGACTAYPVGWLSDKLGNGRKPYVYVSCAVLALGSLGMLQCTTFQQTVLLSFLVGGANGAYLTMDTSLAVDTLPHKEDAAKFLGIWGVAGFCGSALGPMAAGPLLYFIGTVGMLPPESEGEQVYSIAGYAVIYSLSALYFGCSAVSLRWVDNSY